VDSATGFLLSIILPVIVVVIAAVCLTVFWFRAKREPPPLIFNENYHLVVSADIYFLTPLAL
jgi:hypothetical protein